VEHICNWGDQGSGKGGLKWSEVLIGGKSNEQEKKFGGKGMIPHQEIGWGNIRDGKTRVWIRQRNIRGCDKLNCLVYIVKNIRRDGITFVSWGQIQKKEGTKFVRTRQEFGRGALCRKKEKNLAYIALCLPETVEQEF